MNGPAELLIHTSAGPVHVTTPVPRETWWTLAHTDAATNVTQTPAWLDCVCATGPFRDASRLYAFENGSLLVLPLVTRLRRPPPLTAQESWPGEWGIGGPVSSGAVGPREARAVFDDLARLPALRVGVRLRPEDAEVWTRAVPAAFQEDRHTVHVLDLEGGFGTVWERRFHQSTRRGVRRAERSDVDVEVDRTGRLVPEFYQLFEQSIVRWAARQHEPLALARWRRRRAFPRERLQAVADLLGGSCAIWVARRAGEPAAAIVVLRHGHHAKLWHGAMNRDLAHPVRANQLLHRLAIDDACAAGCLRYDFGGSRQGASLAAFKEGFGAELLVSPRYYRERLPVSAVDRALRTAAKRVIRFKEG
ncbi:GNAT family N-acetyltransferase [Streptomyces sp. NPDC101209]|uniref:GNAT family N-acetyltransferase n=1 Tax=Streptomyces sp. NPDC101209 TaxID=3366129 RepID=UPI00380CECBF